jgi:hypothetical protein
MSHHERFDHGHYEYNWDDHYSKPRHHRRHRRHHNDCWYYSN